MRDQRGASVRLGRRVQRAIQRAIEAAVLGGLRSERGPSQHYGAEALERRTLLTATLSGMPDWQAEGPGPITGGQVRLPSNNDDVSGAVTAIMFDPTPALNGSVAYIATTGGGVWKSTNMNVVAPAMPTWTPLSDRMPAQNISALAMDPAQPNIIYAGTGTVSSASRTAQPQEVGIFKSINGGLDWSITPTLLEGSSIRAIVARNDGRLLVGTDDGLYLGDTNAGFQLVADPAIPIGFDVSDLKQDPGNHARIYAAIIGAGIFRSDNSGDTWQNITTSNLDALPGLGTTDVFDATRILLSVSPASRPGESDPVYAAFAVSTFQAQASIINRGTPFSSGPPSVALVKATMFVNTPQYLEPGDSVTVGSEPATIESVNRTTGLITLTDALTQTHSTPEPVIYADPTKVGLRPRRLTSVWRSGNLGSSWIPLTLPGDSTGGLNNGGQAKNHLSIVADPHLDASGRSVLYMGGDLQPQPTDASVGSNAWTGRLFRGTLDAKGTATDTDDVMTWEPITDLGANNTKPTGPHADSRTLVFNPAGTTLFDGDDGGIFQLSNPGDKTTRTWSSAVGNLSNTEFYSVAWDRNTNRIIGGAQDVGVSEQSSAGFGPWTTVLFGPNNPEQGDGGIVDTFNGISSSQIAFVNDGFDRFSYAGAAPALNVNGTGLVGPPPGPLESLADFDEKRPFVTQYAVNSINGSQLFIGTRRLYESLDSGATLTLMFGNVIAPSGTTPASAVNADVGVVHAIVYGGNDADLSLGAAPNAVKAVPNISIVGTDGGKMSDGSKRYLFVRQPGDPSFAPVTSYKGAAVRDIAVDPLDRRNVYVLDENNRIWFSQHGDLAGSADWNFLRIPLTNLENAAGLAPGGDLSLRTIVIAHLSRLATPALLAGGTNGVYRKLGSGPWTKLTGSFGHELPNALVTDLRWYGPTATSSHDTLVVGTFGRGAYTIRDAAATLQTSSILTVSPDVAGDDVIELDRTKENPWRLDVYLFSFGGLKPSSPTKSFDLAGIQQIVLNGGSSDDRFIFDVPGGAIQVPGGIVIHGGASSVTGNRIQIIPQTGISFAKGTLNDPVKPTGSFKFSFGDPYGNIATQTITWDSIQHGSTTSGPIASNVDPIRDGFGAASGAFRAGPVESTGGTDLAALDLPSFTNGLGGLTRTTDEDTEDRTPDVASEEGPGEAQNRTSLLRRIIEEGLHGFSLASIGTSGSISTPLQLRAALDALDSTPNNVTLDSTTDQDGDGHADLLFHAQISKVLTGGADLAIAAAVPGNLGQISLSAGVEFSANVKIDLTFGVDGTGFFIRPDPNVPEVQISNLQLTGDIEGHGRIGFLGVDINGASLTMDAATLITLDLLDPGTDAADGLIRIPEFAPDDFTTLFQMQVRSAPNNATSDLVLAGSFVVSAIVPGLNAAIPLAQSSISVSWPTLGVSNLIGFLPPGVGDAADAMLKFANLSGVDVFGQLSGFQSKLGQLFSTPTLNQPLPFAPSVNLNSLIDAGKAFTDSIINPLKASDGTAAFFTLQDMLGRLAGKLGLNLNDPNLVQYNQASGDLLFHVPVHYVFPTLATTVQIDTSVAGSALHLSPIPLSLNSALDFGLSFGLNLKNASPLSTFFVQMDSISAHVTAQAGPVNVSGTAGPLSYTVNNATVTLDGSVALTIKDPTQGDRFTSSDFVTVLGNPAANTTLTMGGSVTVTAQTVLATVAGAVFTANTPTPPDPRPAVKLVVSTAPVATDSLLEIPNASLTATILNKTATLSVQNLKVLNNGQFSISSATLSGNNLLGVGDFLPLTLNSLSLTGVNGVMSTSSFRVNVSGQFSSSLFQNDLVNPVIQVGDQIKPAAGALFNLGVQYDGTNIKLFSDSTPLTGPLKVGFTGFDFGGFQVDAALSIGQFTGGAYQLNSIGLDGGVKQGKNGGTATFGGLTSLAFSGQGVVTDAGSGNTQLQATATISTGFDTGSSGPLQVHVDGLSATFDMKWVLKLSPTVQFISSSLDFDNATVQAVKARFGGTNNSNALLLFAATAPAPTSANPHPTAASFNFRDTTKPWMTFGSLTASLPGISFLKDPKTGLATTGTVSNFAVGRNLDVQPLPGFGVTFSNLPGPAAFGLPDFLPFSISKIGFTFAGQDNHDLILIVSAGFDSSKLPTPIPVQFSASVSDMRVNLTTLASLATSPSTDPTKLMGAVTFGGFSVGIDNVNLGPLQIGGQLGLTTLVDPGPDNLTGTTDDHNVLVGTIGGFFSMGGFGGGVKLIISEVGPIVASLDVPLGIPLGPTGLLLTGVSGGFRFGGSTLGGVLPSGTDVLHQDPGLLAKTLLGANSGIFDPLKVTDDIINSQILSLVHAHQASWNLPFTVALSGHVSTVASPGILDGTLTLAAQVDLTSTQPDIRFVGAGSVNVFGIPVGGVGALLDFNLSNPFAPTFYLAAAVPLPGSLFSFLFPVQAELDVVVSTDGLFTAPVVGLQALLKRFQSGALPAITTSLNQVLAQVVSSLRSGPPRPGIQILLPLLNNKPAGFTDAQWFVQQLVNMLPASPSQLPTDPTQLQSLGAIANAVVSEIFFNARTIFSQATDSNWTTLFSTFTGEMANAVQAALVDGAKAAWASFNPIFFAHAIETPSLFGIQFGDSQGLDVRITKDGFSFGGNSTLNKILSTLGPPPASVALSLLPSDTKFDVEFALSGISNFLQSVIGGTFPNFDRSLNLSGKFVGDLTLLGFDLAQISGLIVSPNSPLLAFPDSTTASNGTLLRVYNLPSGGVDPTTGAVTIPPNFSGLIPIATAADFTSLTRFGGVLFTGQLSLPLMLADPVAMIAQGTAAGTFTPKSDLVAYVNGVKNLLLQNQEMARLQIYIPGTGDPNASLNQRVSASFVKGFMTSKLLSVPLGTATLNLTAAGLQVSANVLGVQSSFTVGRRTINVNSLVSDLLSKLNINVDLSSVPVLPLVDVPVASWNATINAASLGLGSVLQGNLSASVFSPAFSDPADAFKPLIQRAGGVVLDGHLGIPGFVNDATAHFEMALFDGVHVPNFAASLHINNLAIPGFGPALPTILNVSTLDASLTKTDTGTTLVLTGGITLLNNLLTLNITQGTFTIDSSGLFGDVSIGGTQTIPGAGFSLSGAFRLQVNTSSIARGNVPPGPYLGFHVNGDLNLLSLLDVAGDLDLVASDQGIVATGQLSLTGQGAMKDALHALGFDSAVTVATSVTMRADGRVEGSFDGAGLSIVLDRFGGFTINGTRLNPFDQQFVYVDEQRFPEAVPNANVIINLRKPDERDLNITYQIDAVSALSPADFTPVGKTTVTVRGNKGTTQLLVPITIVDNSVIGDKTFRVTIVSAVYPDVPLGFPSTAGIDPNDKDALMTIDDDDADKANKPVAISVAAGNGLGSVVRTTESGLRVLSGSLTEGGITSFTLTADTLGPQDAVVVRYTLVPKVPGLLTADYTSDFSASGNTGGGATGQVTLFGTAPQTIRISTVPDSSYELNEQFELILQIIRPASAAPVTTIDTDKLRVTITNDDQDKPPGALVFYDFDAFPGGKDIYSPSPTYSDPLLVVSDFRHSGEVPAVPGTFTTPTVNSALSFVGGVDHARSFDSTFPLPTGAITADFWVNPSSVATRQTLLQLGASGLRIFIDAGVFIFSLTTTNGTSTTTITSPFGAARAGAWQHVAVTYSGSVVSAYVNGVQTGGSGAFGSILYGVQSVMVGANANLGIRESLTGAIDEVRVWTAALPAATVATLPKLSTTGAESNLLINYRFDEGRGATAFNATGNGWDLQLGSTLNSDLSILGLAGRPDWVFAADSPVGAFARYKQTALGTATGVPKIPPVSPTANPSFDIHPIDTWPVAGAPIASDPYFFMTVTRDVPTTSSFGLLSSDMQAVNITGADFFHKADATGPTRWELRYSRDGFASAIASGTTSPGGDFIHQRVTLNTSVLLVHPSEIVEFRLYGLDATGTGRWQVDNFALVGGTILAAKFDHPPVLTPITVNFPVGTTPIVLNVGASLSDPDGDPVSLTGATLTSGSGTITRSGNKLQFTPTANAPSTNVITVTFIDRWAATGTGTITWHMVGDALSDSFTTAEDTSLTGNVITNDRLPFGQTATVSAVGTLPAGLTLNSSGSFTYSPPLNFNGSVNFTYKITGPDWTDTAPVTISVTPVNDLPVTKNDSYAIFGSSRVLTVAAPGVLLNDVDADGDPMTLLLVTVPAHGTLSISANGAFTYTPDADFGGIDSFTYRARDQIGLGNTATVTISVPMPPGSIGGTLGTGTFLLFPGDSTVTAGQTQSLRLEWTVPTGSWHVLNEVFLRFSDANGTVSEIKFDEATKTVSLLNTHSGKFGPAKALGSKGVLSDGDLTIHLETSSALAIDPTSPTVFFDFEISFNNSLAGRDLLVDVAANDDLGHNDSFARAGKLRVGKAHGK